MESKDQLAGHRFELSKSVLYLSALGLFAKLLKADVGGAILSGVPLRPEHAGWASGLIGMVLLFAMVALVLCILEGIYNGLISGTHSTKGVEYLSERPALVALVGVFATVASIVYFMPLALGAYTSWKLWPETVTTMAALWRML